MSKGKKIYSEVYKMLTILGDEYIRSTPTEILNFIADNRDKEYDPNIIINEDLENQGLSKEAIAIIAMLKLDYWTANNPAEHNELLKLLNDNESSYLETLNASANIREFMKILKNKTEGSC